MPAALPCHQAFVFEVGLKTLLAFLLLAPEIAAQYRFDSWTTDNGLPHDGVVALRQTRDGYLWLTTGDGLVRFDGARFRVFNRANTPGMPSNGFSFFTLLEDRQGALWAGTWSGGLIRHLNGVFTAYTTEQGLPNNGILRIDEDAEGAVWIFTNPGLARWKDGRLTRVAPGPDSQFNDHLVAPKNMGVDGRFFGLWRVLADLAEDISECEDGGGALEAYARARPDWVLIDIKMGLVDGITATQQIRAFHPAARVIFVTGHDSPSLREAARRAGACAYVLKENLFEVRLLLQPPADDAEPNNRRR